ncbi:DNA replication complex GINS protein SLD5-like isoform X1 [Oratosquilla oratoria]|uniref:DNA replication complex GINS protein SLD5-like isoform X1 n=1 Tax=Oratosquilla oratoria TaxID=337810 RepID=UPI003F75B38A
MLDQLKQRTKNLEKCKKHDFRVAVHKIEIDRIHFIICSYLRTCLHKIEQYTHCLLEREEKITDESMATISPEELRYAKEYAASLESHFQTLVLQHVLDKIQAFDATKMGVKSNLDAYLFLKR